MRALGVFATAPIPGRVKPRLAADVGPSVAAEVYWHVGRKVVAATLGSGYRTTVWFSPPTEAAFIREWLDGLGAYDVVLGPSVDGGYYLIGLIEPQPALFRAIPWGTAAVLAQTRARIAGCGLRLLKPLRDVDTARDARALGFLKP